MPQISVISKESHKVLDQVESNQVGLIENSVIVVKIPKEDVASITKNGADAIITLKNGEVITVQNYFSEATPDNSLVFEDDDGTLYWAKFTTANGDIADVIQYQPLDEIEPLLYNDSLTGVILPWIAGAGGAGLLGAAIGGGSDSSGGSKDTTKPDAPKDVVITDDGEHVTGKGEPGTTVEVKDQDGKVIGTGTVDSSGNFDVELKDPLTNGETVDVTVTDNAGNESEPTEATAKDTTKPDAPNATLNEDGTVVTGKTEPGAKVEVRDENGKLIGSGTANSLGEFEIPVSPAVTDGETAKVTAKDSAGNTSDPTTVTGGKDTLKPASPDATLNEDGTVVTGKTEPGAKVEVRDENGKLIGSGNANSLGDFEISVSPAVTDGETAKVTAKDSAGNTSDPTTVTGGKDTLKPASPDATLNEDGTAVTGKTEPGAKVEVRDENGKLIGSGTANSLGEFEITVAPALTDGETAQVTAKDAAGNTSDPTTVTGGKDTLKPASPDATLNADGTIVTGKTEPGAKVEVRDENGKLIGSGNANSLGDFEIPVSPAVTDGETAQVTAKDAAGNTSDPTTVTGGKDTTKPDAPKDVVITDDGEHVTGKGEPGTTVEVKDQDGKVIGTGTVDSSGNFDVELEDPLTNGETVDVTVTDKAGNKSEPTEATAKDTTKPDAPNATLNAEGTVVTGKTEPGAKVEVRDENGKLIGSGTANSLGEFEITVSPAVTDGETAKVTAKDAAGNTSDPTIVTGGKDTTKPDAPKDVVITDDGEHVTGKGEPGTTVDVKDQDGKIIGTGTVDSSGKFDVELKDPLTNGETVDVTVTDKAGNESEPTEATAKDTTKPDAPKDVVITDDGEHVTGKGEPGTIVEVKDQDGKIIGTGTVDSSGNFDVELKDPLTNGETVDVTVTDKAGNESEPTEATAKDTTKPDAPKDVVITDDGEHVTGKGEPGTIVEVKDQDGKIIGTGTVDSSGNFDVELKDPLTNGETVDVTVTDEAGNESEPTEATAKDTTKPDAPNSTLNEDGTAVTGKTEPGAKVEVRDENGKLIGSGTANSLGEFEIPVSPAVTDGETAKVTAKDAAGNTSDPTTVIGAKDTINPEISIEDTTLTQDSMPTFKGKTEAGTDVSVVIRDSKGEIVNQGKAEVIGDQWSYRADKTLIDGEYSVEAIAKDAAGNTGRATDTSFTIDATAPIVTIDDFKEPNFTGTVNEDANLQVQVQDSNGKDIAGTTTVKDGTWTFTPDSPVAEADYTVTVTATDAAGNQQIETGTVNTTLPTVDIDDLFGTSNFAAAFSRVSTLSVPANVPQTNQTKPTFSGTSTKSVEVTVYLRDANNKVIDSGLAKLDTATGKWTYTPANELLEGYYVLEAVSKDAAGNISSPASKTFVIDITDPVIEIQNAVLTNDVTPDVKGKTEIGSTVTVTVKKPNGDVIETGTATVDAKGDWSYSVKANLTDGGYQVTANAKDKAGNISDDVKTQVTVDSSAPKATITIADNGDVKISFSEKVVGFDADDVQVTGGKLKDLAQQADGSWTAKVAANGNDGSVATVKLDIAAGSYSDAAGNAGQAATASHSVASIDSTAPTATISIADNGDVKISFSEKVVGFDIDDVQVTGGKLKDSAQQADGSWTAKVVANGTDGSAATVKLDIAAGSYSDAAGNAGQAATASHSVASIDSSAPKATITIADNGDVKISFSEKVVGFDADDVQVSGGKLKDFAQQADGSWTAKVVANGTDGSAATVKLDIAAGSYSDAAGNAGQAATASHSVASIDSTAPTATISISDNGDVKISFSEKVVGFDADDVQVTGGKLNDFAQQVDGSWTAKVVANGNDGSVATVKLDIAAGSYSDAAGNAGQSATASHSVASIDSTAPKATITIADNGDVKISFSEKVVGFDADDVQVTGGKLTDLAQQADGSWTAKVVANGNDGSAATVKIDIAAGSYSDAAGNAGQAATASHSVASIDSTAPKATITIADNGDVKISFSEKVIGFDADDIQITGGKLTDLAQQADGSWTAKVVANGTDGSAATVKIDIAAGSYSDAAGNAGQAATASHSVASIDSTAPKATITIADNGDVKISFSEKVIGFDADDIQITGGKLKDLAQQADGSWTAKVVANGNDGSAATVKLDIAAGSYSDAAGNAGQAATASHSVASIDSTAPTITIDDLIITNDQTPTVSGETEPGASVYVYIKDFAGVVKFEGQASVFADGAWTFTPPRNLDDGEYTAVAIATDKAGNTAEANDGFEIDTTPPTVDIDDFDFFAAPAVAPLATFAMRATTLSTPSIPQTNNNKQTFSGTSSKSTEVQINIYDAENNLLDSGLAKLDTATGKWTYTPSVALPEGLLTLEAISKDIAGNISAPSTKQFIVDTIPPLIDIHDVGVITDPSPSFSGKTEKGVTVTVNVKDQLGNVVETGQALVDVQGNWSYQATSNLTNGLYHIEAIAKDAAGNSSQKATTSTTIDSTADVSIDVQANADGSATVTGKTEPGASVEITTPDGQTYPASVDANGHFTAMIPSPAAEGTYTATATDQAGNQGSASADLDDQIAPQIDDLEVDANTDGSATVTGKTEPGASVEITTPDGQTYPASVDANGHFTATIPSPAAEGTYTATATDNAGNQGSATADLDDQVAPQITDLEVDANTDGSATVTGKTEPGASVEITTPNGQTYPASVDANGHFTATIPTPAAEGTYTATATDQAGNQGSASADLDDQIAPQIDDFKVTSNPDGSATITGKTESGAKISITDPQGKDIDVTVDANGHFIAQIPATAAEGTYTATATDQAGNQGYASDDLMDATMPVIPTAEVNQKDGSTVFGKAQPGSEVTVYASDSKQKLGTAVADANGAYSVQLQPALVDGEQVKVTAKDAGGESPAITAQAPDLFAPDAPTAKVNATGSAVEGVTEAFAIVTVYGGSKGTTPLGTATADANGHYSIALLPALVDGEQVKVTAKDAGGESLATPALAPDLYAPATPFATLDSQGAVVTGHAEAGSDITVYAADAKTILGTAIADLEGNFKVVLQPAVTDGQHILVTAKDDGGESAPQELIAPTVSIHAADNLVNANINFEYPVEEVRTNKLFNVFDLINIGSKVHTGYFSIGDQEVGEATISVHTGSLINLFDKAEMRLFVKNADGSWKLIASNKDYGLLDFIGIFGEETAVRAKNLQSGEYKFEFVGGSAIGLATSVSANLSLKVFDTSVEPEVSHVEEAKGNVITDHDALYGQDAVPAGSIVNSINGQLINGTTTIKGNYGTLTIHQDGSYSYKPKADVTAIGKAEVFSYSVVDPVSGKASSADLIIHIGTQSDLALNWNAAEPKDHASTVVATNNVDMIGFDASNTVSTGNSSSISYSWSIGFGGTKAGSTKITVADGTVENIKVDFGSSQLVSLLGNTTINVYDEKGKLVATSGASTVVDVIGLLPNGNSVTVTGLKAGTYTIQAVTNKGISLGGSVSAVISRSIIDLDSFTVKSAANAATKGNLLTDNDGFGVDTVASKYTDLYVSKDGGLTFTQVSSTGTTITAKYGEMVVKSDGSYTYTLKDTNLTSGAAEQFTYKLVAPNGDISAATLTIKAGVNFTGSVGNDEITSTAGNDQFTTKAGIDTVIYKVLDQADATGGNGHDTWNDFNASEGDKVNIKALLQGQNVNQSNIDQFVSVKSDGKGNTVISIDRDGTGSKFGDKVELLTLKNTDVTLQDLIDHNQLLY